MKSNIRRGLAAAGMGAAVVLAQATALGDAKASSEAEPLKLATGNDYAPFVDRRLPGGGMATRVVRQAFAAVQRPVEIDFVSWPRAYAYALDGIYDATFPYVHTAKRAESFLYSKPIVVTKSYVISAAAHPVPFAGSLDSLNGRRLCMPKGYALYDRLATQAQQGRISVERPSTPELCVRLLMAGRVDFLVLNVPAFKRHMAKEGGRLSDFHVSEQPISERSLHLIAAKSQPGSAAVIRAFERGLRQLHDTGTYDDIIAAR